jgi:hypothetical protein
MHGLCTRSVKSTPILSMQKARKYPCILRKTAPVLFPSSFFLSPFQVFYA